MPTLYILTLHATLPDNPTTDELYHYICDLGVIADRLSADGHEGIASLGDMVQLAALCALTSPVADMPIPAAEPSDAAAWLTRHGGIVDTCAQMVASGFIALGDVVPTLASLLAMECPAELAQDIRAAMP